MNTTTPNQALEMVATVGELRQFKLQCPICERTDWLPAFRVRRAQLFQCGQCGLLGTGSFILGLTNPDQIYDVGPDAHRIYQKWYQPNRLHSYRRILSTLERFRQTERLLEVGSAYGDFLEFASGFRWRAEGVELAQYACEVARSRGCTVTQGKLEDIPLERSTYDIVILWDVIEHLPNVGAIVEQSFDLLRSGGALVARTPDGRALLESRGLLGAAYRHLAYPANTAEHVFHFTPENLAALLSKNGFEQITADTAYDWPEIIIGGKNGLIRSGRSLIFRVAHHRNWPYEFVATAVKR